MTSTPLSCTSCMIRIFSPLTASGRVETEMPTTPGKDAASSIQRANIPSSVQVLVKDWKYAINFLAP